MATTSLSLGNNNNRCPYCGHVIMHTERRFNGNSTCVKGHVFKTSEAVASFINPFNALKNIPQPDISQYEELQEFNRINERLKLLDQYLEINLNNLTPIRRSRLLNMKRYMGGYLAMLQEDIEDKYARQAIPSQGEG